MGITIFLSIVDAIASIYFGHNWRRTLLPRVHAVRGWHVVQAKVDYPVRSNDPWLRSNTQDKKGPGCGYRSPSSDC
jgi:hypothetical protein